MENDYISRQAIHYRKLWDYDETGTGIPVIAVSNDEIDAIPPADVRPVVRGRWIKLDMHRGMEQYKCSACRSEGYVPECMGEPMYCYCPNCGADMREETS